MTTCQYYPHPPLSPLTSYPASVRWRIDIERRICRKMIRTLRRDGYRLRVNSGEEWETRADANENELMRALFNLDDAWLVVRDRDNKKCGWIRLIFGNDGYDVVNDYTTNLETVLAPVFAYADAFEGD